MGRTRIAQAVIRDLKEKKENASKRKNELISYLKRLNQAHFEEKLSGAEYIETLHKKNDGRNIKEWVDYYENYSKNCETEIKKQKREITKSKVPVFLFSILLISIFIYFSISTSFFNLNLTGLFVGEQREQQFSQNVNITLDKSTTYNLELENIGQLTSLKINGLIEGEGEVKVYLENLLILDSSNNSYTKSKTPKLTGQIIEENPIAGPIENTNNSYSEKEAPSKEESSPSQGELLTENLTQNNSSNESLYSEEKTQPGQPGSEATNESEALPKEESSPSQEEPQPSESNMTEVKNETITSIRKFTGVCTETCDLTSLNLNESSYNIRIEITNAKLLLDTIDYTLIPTETSEETNLSLTENTTINTTQYKAVLGQPVKWKKQISLNESGPTIVELPKEAENIVVNKIIDSYSEKEAPSKEESSPSQGELLTENNQTKERANADIETKIKSAEEPQQKNSVITGNTISNTASSPSDTTQEIIQVTINDNATDYEIEYETPAPYAIEENLSNGKRVKIVGSEEVHYENVLSFTNLSEKLNIKDPSQVKVYWIENETYLPTNSVQDTNSNGIYDYVEWTAPHLSNQTFEIIIITKAEHIDSNRNFISNIYEQVKSLDDIWSETIPANDYVRVTFEVPLDNTKDITIFPRIVSGNPSIEVYEKDGTEKIAEFKNINSNDYNKVYLKNLKGSQDTFDLKIIGGSLEFDYILDPGVEVCSGINCIVWFNTSGSDTWTVPSEGVIGGKILVEAWGGGGSGGNGTGGGGAGGQYAKTNLSVTGGQVFNIYVAPNQTFSSTNKGNGTMGFNTSFSNSTANYTLAVGGNFGWTNASGKQLAWGGNGTNKDGIGDVVYAGGWGAKNSSATAAGGGGGGGGSTGAGGNASTTTGGTGASQFGGNGGNGPGATGNGGNGTFYGSGGSGSRRGRIGGFGMQGLLKITYTKNDTTPPTINFEIPPTPSNTSSTASPFTIVANISDSLDTSSWIDLDKSLVGYWAMNYYDGTGIFDNSTYGHQAVYTDGISSSDITTGIRGKALNINGGGVGYYLDAGNILDLGTQSWTYSLWLKETTSQRGYLVTKGASGGYNGVRIETYTDQRGSVIIGGASDYYENIFGPNIALDDGNWHHIVVVLNRTGNAVWYTDTVAGTPVDITEYSGENIASADDFKISDEWTYINGLIDEVMVFNRSLSQTEILALYNSKVNKFNTSSLTLANGQHNYTIYAIDAAGNVNNSGWNYFTLSGTGVTSCGTPLDSTGTNYILTSNVTSTGTCFTISADNVTLDCQNYWITYGTDTADSEYGITSNYLNTTIKNCNILDGDLADTTNPNTDRTGIISYGDYTTLINNYVAVCNSSAIAIAGSNYNNITNNYGNSTYNRGLALGATNYNNVTNNIFSGGDKGMYLGTSNYSTFINNTGIGTGGVDYAPDGIFLWDTSMNNIFINNTGISNGLNRDETGSGAGLVIYDSSNNTFIGQTAISNLLGGVGLTIPGANNSIIKDCINITSSDNNIVVGGGYLYPTGLNNTFVNCSYNQDKEYVSSNGQLIRKWYYRAYANYTNGSAASNVNITAKNSTGKIQFTAITDSSGWITKQEITDYVNNRGTTAYYSNYTLTANKSGYTNFSRSDYNVTAKQNNVTDFFTFAGGSDSTPPTYSQYSTNNTVAGLSTNFSINVNDNSALNPNGGYIFSTNNTWGNATWKNDSFVLFTTTPSWANVTKVLNSTVGTWIGYRWYFNDTSGNTNSTPIYNLTTTSSSTFSATWNTSKNTTGTTNSSQIGLPLENGGQYNFNVDWGDTKTDTITTWNDPKTNHTYITPGIYTVNITGTIIGFRFNNLGDKLKITNINSWGPLNVGNNGGYFYGCSNLNSTATDNLNLTGTTDFSNMFSQDNIFNGNISGWNTSNAITMNSMFASAQVFNQNISGWDTGKVTAMIGMFWGAATFNQNLSNWNTSSVTNMNIMFDGAYSFNGNISNWNTSKVIDMSYMFQNAQAFNQNLSNWNTSKVTDMNHMFNVANVFNGNISNWDTSKVTDMSSMFEAAGTFNQNIGNWNTGKVVNMKSMFWNAAIFNQNFSNWNTGNVTDMSGMFGGSLFDFNGNISNWNTGNVTDMNSMFSGAEVFNQNISGWNTGKVINMENMFANAYHFNQSIGNWNTSNVIRMGNMFSMASDFNQNISGWNTSNVLYMNGMFWYAYAFNQNISNWNTKNVASMYEMFRSAISFNGNISNWNTSNVTNMQGMFFDATAFNQNISAWNTAKVTNMNFTFKNATSFNQNLGNWNVSKVISMVNMTYGVTLSTANYDSLLVGWGSRIEQYNVPFHGGNSQYTSTGLAGRNTLTGTYNWVITDGGLSGSDSTPPTITFEEPNPTPSNGSSTANPVTIVANISDASNTSSFIDLDKSLLGYWSMDYYNSTGVYDNSTYNNFGTFNGAFNYSNPVTGARGNARRFNGINDYIQLGFYISSANIQATGTTWGMWIKTTNIPTVHNTIITQTGNAAGSYERYGGMGVDNTGKAYFVLYNGSAYIQPTSTTSVNDGQWHYVVGVFTLDKNMQIYVDGSLEDTKYAGVAGDTGANNFRIASGDTAELNMKGFFNGSIDEVMIFNRSFSSTEIKALYDSKNNKFNTSSMNLVNGQHNYTVYAIDQYGNVNNSGWRNFTTTSGGTTCGDSLSTAGTTYTLTSNVSSTGTCFTIAANNITLNCNGYWINYSTNGNDGNYGIYALNRFNVTIKNCNIFDANRTTGYWSSNGIYLSGITNSTIFNNFVNGSNSPGIYIDSSSNYNNITSNTGTTSGSSQGIRLDHASNYNTLINNTAMSGSNEATALTGNSSFNIIINHTTISPSGRGVFFWQAANHNTFINTNTSGDTGFEFNNASDNRIVDCTSVSGTSNDVYFDNIAGNFNNTFVNCSYNINKETVQGAGSQLLRKWYYQTYVNYTNGSAASNANVTATNATGTIQFTAQTDSSGFITKQEIIDYNNTGTRTFYSNYTITANKSGYTNSSKAYNLTIQQNKVNDYLTLISGADSTPPTYSQVSTNNSIAGQINLFSINVTDNVALHTNGQYIFSTNNSGAWVNYSAFGNQNYWQTDLVVNDSLPNVGSYSSPNVFYKDSSWYLISGNSNGGFSGYAWNGTSWKANTTINTSLFNDTNAAFPTVFYKDSSWYLISGDYDGKFYGYAWNGTNWKVNTTINASLPNLGYGFGSAPYVFYKDSSWYLISGNASGKFYGYAWNGTQWLTNLTINASLPDIGSYSTPSVFYKDGNLYLISGSGNSDGKYYGYAWNGTQWLTNLTINASLTNFVDYSVPSFFNKDGILNLIAGGWSGNFYGYNYSTSYNFTTTPSWTNITLILNSTVGTGVGYKWYFTDNISNTNSTPIYILTTTSSTDSIPPTYSQISINNSLAGNITKFSVNISDNTALNPNGMYIFATNNTWANATLRNDSPIFFTTTPYIVNVTKTLNSTVGKVIGYKWYFNDSAGNINSTPTYILTTSSAVSCGDSLSTPGATYYLTTDVASIDGCFSFSANNITLDCQGHWITYHTDGTGDDVGIWVDHFNTTIKDCNVVNGYWGDDGGYFTPAILIAGNSSTLLRSFGWNTPYYYPGIDIESWNNNITNNTGLGRVGIGTDGCVNNTFVNNNASSPDYRGMSLSGGSRNNLFIGNNISSGASDEYGLIIEGASNSSTFINNTMKGATALYLYDGGGPNVNNTFINNTAIATASPGIAIQIDRSSNNTFIMQTALSLLGGGESSGFNIWYSNNTMIRDCVNITGSDEGFDIDFTLYDGMPSMNTTIINCSYNTADNSGPNMQLIRKWYYKTYVNQTNGSALSNANVTAKRSSGDIIFTTQTDSLGWTERQEVIDYVDNGGTITFYSNYSMTMNKSGYTNSSKVYNFTIQQNKVDDYATLGGGLVAPVIYNVTSISPVTLTEGPGKTFIIVNFSVYDFNGASNLNNASASINFTKSGESLRYNSSCAVKNFAGSYANYTCNVTMFWWDAAGTDWRVYANISDLDSYIAVNDTTTFTVNPLTGFVMSPTALTFSSLPAGSSNQTPTNYLLLNNTGNTNVSNPIEINATDLVGETDHSKILWASNFSASPYTGGNIECNITASATAMVNKTFVSVSNTILSVGNYTKNDGTAQEQIYLCARKVGMELTQQQYSTNAFGSWTVRIVLVSITIRRKRKNKSNNKTNVVIPTTIFSKELGALESISKYMKENLGMSYHNIAELLNRDERTIWTAYNKANEKQKESIEVKATEIFIPISVLNNRELTILESVINYLREKDMKYSEIAKLINRDQRNVRAIYTRIEKRLKRVTFVEFRPTIPTTIFSKELGALESISKYMKENLGMSYHNIAELLNRDERTIWTAYNKANEKQKESIEVKATEIFIPISVLNNRELTILESVINYLREKDMKYSEIAKLINRDQRNVRAIYNKTKNNI